MPAAAAPSTEEPPLPYEHGGVLRLEQSHEEQTREEQTREEQTREEEEV